MLKILSSKLLRSSRAQQIYIPLILIALFLIAGAIGRQLVRPQYAELESQLITIQAASPENALALAEDLMRDYPSECLPYEAAANIYSLKKAYGAAESMLQAAIDTCRASPALYVRLAHLYQRVMPEKLDPWMFQMLRRPEVMDSPTLAARLLCVSGHLQQAIQRLKRATRTLRTSSSSVEIRMMLSRLYGRENQPNKARQTLMALARNHALTRADKLKLLRQMLCLKAPLNRPQTDVCLTLMLQLAGTKTGYVDGRQVLIEHLGKLMRLDKDKHAAALLQRQLGQYADQELRAWLASVYLQEIEQPEAAYALLSEVNITDTRVLEEKARLSAHSHDLKQIKQCWQALLKRSPDDLRIRLTYGHILNQAGFNAASRQTVAGFVNTDIPEGLRWSYFSLCFDNHAALKKYSALVDTWRRAGRYYRYADFLVFKDIIFSRLPETEQHQRLLAAVAATRTDLTPSQGIIDLLQVFIAEQLRNPTLYYSAADAFLTKQTTCTARTINVFVDSAIRKAMSRLHNKASGEKADHRRNRIVQFATKWSAYLVAQHPNNPRYQSNEIISRYLSGAASDLTQRCRNLLDGNETSHYHLQLVAETLLRIGRFEKAAGHYQAAIALRPDIIRYKISYAACLNKLHKYEQSRAIYAGLITRHGAGSIDMGTVLQQLWFCYEKLQRSDDFFTFIQQLKTPPHINSDQLTLAAGTLLLSEGRYREAEVLLREYINRAPLNETRYDAYLKLARCCALQEKYDQAIELYTNCLRQYKGDILKTIDCLYNRAEINRRRGDYQAAIEDWRRIAQRYPADGVAAEALLAAASLAHNTMRDLPQARRLYNAYLNLPGDHGKMTAMVKEKLATIPSNN